MRKKLCLRLTAQVPNIVPLTTVATETPYYANVNTTCFDETSEVMPASTESSLIYLVTILKDRMLC